MNDLTPANIKDIIESHHRIFVWGNGGSGKTTLAELLGKKKRISQFSLDKVQWNPGWTFKPDVQTDAILRTEVEKPTWIIEFAEVKRLELVTSAGLVLWLDPPVIGCLKRVLKRSFLRRFVLETHLGPEPIKGVIKLLQWVREYPKKRKPVAEKIFSNYVNVIRISDWNTIKTLIRSYREVK